MQTDQLIRKFAELFAGRTDVYGSEEGSCVKRELTLEHYRDHLMGVEPIGVYPIRSYREFGDKFPNDPVEFYVKWGCSDIDVDDLQAARNLQAALKVLGITSWIEVSRSKGYHVWVFAEVWVPAAIMRRALLVAHKLADVLATEVNPKQETLSEGQVGNYVRLPYPEELVDGTGIRRVMLHHDNFPMSLEDFLALQAGTDSSTAVLQAAADIWVPLAKNTVIPDATGISVDQDLTTRLNGLAWTILQEGPVEGGDRSTTLAKLAHQCAASELTPTETYAIVDEADSRWGKFNGRPDREEQLRRIVENAYG